MSSYQCIGMISYKSKKIIGKIMITDTSIVFTSLSITLTIKYQDITTYTNCTKGIIVDQILLCTAFKNRLFKEILKRVDAFRRDQSRENSEIRRRTVSSPRLTRSSSHSSKRSENMNAERYTWMKVQKNSLKMDLQEFFYEIQANPPIMMMPSAEMKSANAGSVVFKKVKWVSFTELLQAKEIVKDIGYNIHHTGGQQVDDVIVKMFVKISYNAKLVVHLNYELPTTLNASKLKVFIRLKSKEVSKQELRFKVEYDVEFGDLRSIDQLTTRLEIERQIREHFKQLFMLEKPDIATHELRSLPSTKLALPKSVWVPQFKKIEMYQAILLLLWIVTVVGLTFTIMIQKDMRKSVFLNLK